MAKKRSNRSGSGAPRGAKSVGVHPAVIAAGAAAAAALAYFLWPRSASASTMPGLQPGVRPLTLPGTATTPRSTSGSSSNASSGGRRPVDPDMTQRVQNLLLALGIAAGNADGIWGPNTDAGVRAAFASGQPEVSALLMSQNVDNANDFLAGMNNARAAALEAALNATLTRLAGGGTASPALDVGGLPMPASRAAMPSGAVVLVSRTARR